MRHLIVCILVLCGMVQTYAQDTTKRKKQPRFMAPLFIDGKLYAPGKENRFGMTYRFSTGVHATLALGRRTSVMAGGTFANNFALGKYAMTSRSFAQGFFHGAVGGTYTVIRTQSQTLSLGPVWARVAYFPGEYSPTPRGVTNPFTEFSKEVRDSLPGVRGIYYNALYLFIEWRKRFSEKEKLSIEGNIMVPARFKEPLHSWQPRSALVHVVRLKTKYERNNHMLMLDAALPSITKGRQGYAVIAPVHTTGKLEYSYVVKLANGGIRFAAGYERDWHALNFPNLVKHDRERGTWGALYAGVRFEGVLMSKK